MCIDALDVLVVSKHYILIELLRPGKYGTVIRFMWTWSFLWEELSQYTGARERTLAQSFMRVVSLRNKDGMMPNMFYSSVPYYE